MKIDFSKTAKPFGYPRQQQQKPSPKEEKKPKKPLTPAELRDMLLRRTKKQIKNLKQKWWQEGHKEFPDTFLEDLLELCTWYSRQEDKTNDRIEQLRDNAERASEIRQRQFF